MVDPFDNWTVQVRKGLLEFCVLTALAPGERYAYDLVKELVSVADLGVREGTLYPLLSRLRVQGLLRARLVESPEGPARKYYALTAKGRRTVRQMNDYFDSLSGSIEALRGRRNT